MEHIIDPWGSAEISIDEKLIKEFGLSRLTGAERKKLDHYLFSRNIVVAHRDLGPVMGAIEEKKPFIQLTGIASSGPLHLGHKVDVDLFLFFKRMGARSYFAVTDIDAYVSRPDSKVPDMASAKRFAVNNVAHLLALGVEKKDIYVQSRKEPRYYEFALEMSKKITENAFRAIYGHIDPGKLAANLLQYADILHQQLPEYNGPMPSITGIGVEQDPHARAARDIARRLPYKMFLPSFIYFSHQPGLQEGSKMSASSPDTAIYLDDSEEEIKRKINKAFSGGRDSVDEHRKLGGVPERDKAFQVLRYHHPDSNFVEKVYENYRNGSMLSGELKGICKDFLTTFLEKHQKKVRKFVPVAEKIVYG